jgi:hypothetical protein
MKLFVAIDPGVSTGIAIWDVHEGGFSEISTTSILRAFETLRANKSHIELVIVEDAREVKYKTSRVKAQGAGSVKRDCQIWEEFLRMEGIRSKFVRPSKRITKLDAVMFERITGWKKRTSSHARDAAMILYTSKGILK